MRRATRFSLEILVTVEADHREVSVLQQQPALGLPVRHEGKFSDGQRADALPISFDAAQVTAVVVPVVLPLRRRDGVLGIVPSPLGEQRVIAERANQRGAVGAQLFRVRVGFVFR